MSGLYGRSEVDASTPKIPSPEIFRSAPTHTPVTTRALTPSHFPKNVQAPLRVKRRRNSRLRDVAPCAAALFDHGRHGSHSEKRSCCRAGKRRCAGACQDLQWAPHTQPAPDICVRIFTADLPAPVGGIRRQPIPNRANAGEGECRPGAKDTAGNTKTAGSASMPNCPRRSTCRLFRGKIQATPARAAPLQDKRQTDAARRKPFMGLPPAQSALLPVPRVRVSLSDTRTTTEII